MMDLDDDEDDEAAAGGGGGRRRRSSRNKGKGKAKAAAAAAAPPPPPPVDDDDDDEPASPAVPTYTEMTGLRSRKSVSFSTSAAGVKKFPEARRLARLGFIIMPVRGSTTPTVTEFTTKNRTLDESSLLLFDEHVRTVHSKTSAAAPVPPSRTRTRTRTRTLLLLRPRRPLRRSPTVVPPPLV